MKKGFLVLAIAMFLFSQSAFCGGKPDSASPPPSPPEPVTAPAVPEPSAGPSLDNAIQAAARNVEAALPGNSKVAVLNINSSSESLADYIIEELVGALVNGRKLVITDRKNLDLIRTEMNLQLSGDVSDESIQAIGKMLGAEYIVSGSFTDLGGTFRFRVRTINVTTAVIESQSSVAVASDNQIAFLIEKDKPAAPADDGPGVPARREPTTKSGANYKIGDWGPAGGIVFYDKGRVSDGWRYLEAAPQELEATLEWNGETLFDNLALSNSIGSGKKNTALVVDFMEAVETAYRDDTGVPIYAAHYCQDIDYDGFKDWFLPSIDELELMEKNLWQNGLGDFKFFGVYWSSSWTGERQDGDCVVWVYDFYGDQARKRGVRGSSYIEFLVRPIRAF